MVKKEVKKTVKKTMKRTTVKKTMKKASPKKTVKRSTTKKPTAKKSVVDTLSFKKLSTDELSNLISEKAYEFFQERGSSHGNDRSDWYKAEYFIRSRHKM